MRPVDADALIDALHSKEGAEALDHSPLRFIKVKLIIDNVPTIKTIPIEWIEKCQYEMERGSAMWWALQSIIERWQNEQEAKV